MADTRPPLVRSFAIARPTYEAFTESLTQTIRTLAEVKGIEIAQIEKRTKTIESFEEKIGREDKNGKYTAYADMTDLTGVRIVTYLPAERDALIKYLREAMAIDEANSRVISDEVDPDRFGYQSTHLVLSYSPERLALPDFERFAGMRAEIQVRTVLQHAWAAIDWKLRYKNSQQTPRQLRRRLFRISALLESVDDDFTYLDEQIAALRRQYEAEIKSGDLDIEMNLESLTAFLDLEKADRPVVQRLRNAVLGIGNLTLQPPKFSPTYLLKEAQGRGIATIAQFEKKLESAFDAHADAVHRVFVDWANAHRSVTTDLPDVARLALLLTDRKPKRGEALETMFSESFRTSARKTLGL